MNFENDVELVFHDWHYGHPKVLYGLIRALLPHRVVEVGTYRGYAAAWMARALQENHRDYGGPKPLLVCIDDLSLQDHVPKYGDPVKHWEQNLTQLGVRDYAELIVGDSSRVKLPDKIDFAYIDGWHSYLKCRDDFEICAAFGASCICLDDTLNCIGPRMVVDGLTEWQCITLPNDNGLTICHRHVKRRVTFSQELPDNPGTDITKFSDAELSEHLRQAADTNKVFYSGILYPWLHQL